MMRLNDPLGDHADPHPQCADAQQVEGDDARPRKLRERVLDVLQSEGYIRGYAAVEHKDGRSEFEIELKYFDGAAGDPRDRAGVDARAAASMPRSKDAAARHQRPRHLDPLDAEGRDVGSRRARPECRRRNPLHGVLGQGTRKRVMSRIGKKPVAVPVGRHRHVDGQTVKVKGPKGELMQVVLPDDVAVKMESGARHGRSAQRDQARARHVGHCRARWCTTSSPASPRASSSKLEITGVGYRAAVQGKNLQLAARLQPRRQSIRSRRASRSRRRSRPRS